MIETDFEKRESASEAFIQTVVDAIDAAREALADASTYAATAANMSRRPAVSIAATGQLSRATAKPAAIRIEPR